MRGPRSEAWPDALGSAEVLYGMKSDLLTIAAISTVAYIAQNVLHEGLGHGGTCMLVGAEPIALSTAYFNCGVESAGSAAHKFVAASGALVNIIVGLGFWAVLQRKTLKSQAFHLFIWLSMAINLFSGTGYLLFSGALGVGDWVVVVEGLEPVWAWRLVLAIAGAVLYLICIRIALVEMNRLVGSDSNRMSRAHRLSVIPYLVGSTTSTIGAVLNPISPLLILTSAASSFGGTSALAWMTQLYKTERFKPENESENKTGIMINRSWPWIAVSVILLLGHIFLLGPSVEF